MYMFTKGQATSVNSCLEGPRSSFLTAAKSADMEKALPEGKISLGKIEGRPM